MAHKLHIISDLHLNHAGSRIVKTDADAIVIAGDLADGWHHRVHHVLRYAPAKPIIIVLGNHDYIGMRVDMAAHAWRTRIASAAPHAQVHLLTPGVLDMGDTHIIGCTWWSGLGWTEHTPYGHQTERIRLPMMTQMQIIDFQACYGPGTDQFFTIEDMIAIHKRETAFLEQSIAAARSAGKRVVVVTHFGPTRRSIAPLYAGQSLNPYFANDRDDLTDGVDLWIHGHTHHPMDYVVPSTGCRVICNPRGYPNENRYDKSLVIPVEQARPTA